MTVLRLKGCALGELSCPLHILMALACFRTFRRVCVCIRTNVSGCEDISTPCLTAQVPSNDDLQGGRARLNGGETDHFLRRSTGLDVD